MLTIAGVTKRYPSGVEALRSINLTVSSGMFGLLGPNGAGKTTLMKVIATLLRPDRGTVSFAGVEAFSDPQQWRGMLGYLPQEFGFYPSFTAFQMLDYLGALRGVHPAKRRRATVYELLEKLNLADVSDVPLKEYSRGMRQRLGIAQALLTAPRLLIVDEPTAALDPEERLRVHNLLADINQDIVIVLSTHLVSDVAFLCSGLAVLNEGALIATTTPAAAVAALDGKVFEGPVRKDALQDLQTRYRILSRIVLSNELLTAKVYSESGPPGPEFRPALGNLEDAYFSLVGVATGRRA